MRRPVRTCVQAFHTPVSAFRIPHDSQLECNPSYSSKPTARIKFCSTSTPQQADCSSNNLPLTKALPSHVVLTFSYKLLFILNVWACGDVPARVGQLWKDTECGFYLFVHSGSSTVPGPQNVSLKAEEIVNTHLWGESGTLQEQLASEAHCDTCPLLNRRRLTRLPKQGYLPSTHCLEMATGPRLL